MPITAQQLADVVNGTLAFETLPPLDGKFSVVGRVCLDIRVLEEGDVFWSIEGFENSGRAHIEEAFLKGAAGVVADNYHGTPWPGRWVVHVKDSGYALISSALAAISLGVKQLEQENSETNVYFIKQSEELCCRIVEGTATTLLDCCQNASPDMMQQAFRELQKYPTTGKRWVVCGDYCSQRWDDGVMHRQLGSQAITDGSADRVIGCGQFGREIAIGARDAGMPMSSVTVCRQVHEAVQFLKRNLSAGDAVLVAGTRHMNMLPLIEAIQQSVPTRGQAKAA